MKALTLWQPWASLIAEGVKTIETRSWPAPAKVIGETIAIHAAKSMPRTLREMAYADPIGRALNDRGVFLGGDCASLPLGAVVATARLVDCVPMMFDGDGADHRGVPHLCVHGTDLAAVYSTNDQFISDVSDQLPFGHFEPGRWAWLLDDIEKLPEPIPAKGRQKLWEWAA